MLKSAVVSALEAVYEARKQWNTARAKFDADVDYMMMRLLNEAAVLKMSDAEVGLHLGVTGTKVRALMRKHGLNPKSGRNLLAKQAAETLAENSALLGVEPHDFDLTSPLVYLPMGSVLRKFLETNRMDAADLDAIDSDYDLAKKRISTALSMGIDSGDVALPIFDHDIDKVAAWLASEGIK